MKIGKDKVVSIDYTIRLEDGRVVETSVSEGGGPLTYLHGRAQIVPGVERAIEGAEPGSVLEVTVPPDDAYGSRDPSGVFVVPRNVFPAEEDVAAGMTFSATRSDGRSLMFYVVEVGKELVVIDTNHPLAGETLRVSVAVRAVRSATEEEMQVGKVIDDTLAPAVLPS